MKECNIPMIVLESDYEAAGSRQLRLRVEALLEQIKGYTKMIDLLTLCGYEEHELKADLSRTQRCFRRLGITDVDIEQLNRGSANIMIWNCPVYGEQSDCV